MPALVGLLNVDKPSGPTSHDVVDRVRRLAGQRRVGHAGTLDPLASGVLLLCLGRATRLVEYLVGQPKTYTATVRLGQTTATYDAEGEIVWERPVTVDEAAISQALAPFRGQIEQVPPMFSALKRQGQPLYALARQGVTVARPPRRVTVYELELLWCRLPEIGLKVVCSAGTYVRSLAHDLGQALGCGGHLAALRRTAVGRFAVEEGHPLEALTPENLPARLLPLDAAVGHLPRLDLGAAEARKLCQGQPIPRAPGQAQVELARAYDEAGRFLGVVAGLAGGWQARKILV